MSKKSKAKINRQQRAKVIQQSLSQSEPLSQGSSENIISQVAASKNPQPETSHNTAEVKREVKKILVVSLLIIVVLATIKIADNNGGIIIKLADLLSKIFK